MKRFAALTEFFGKTNRSILHAFVRVFGTAHEQEVFAAGDALVLVRIVQPYADKTNDALFVAILILGHALPLRLVFYSQVSSCNYTRA
jgi:hypothetical protein